MPTVKRFEDLEVWQMARMQCRDIFALIEAQPFKDNPALCNQIDRASGSVMDNISEGFDRFSRAEFRQALIIARGSNAEVRSQLYRAFDRLYLSSEVFDRLLEQSQFIGGKLGSLINYLNRTTYQHKPVKQDGLPKDAGIGEEEIIYNYPNNNYNLPPEFKD